MWQELNDKGAVCQLNFLSTNFLFEPNKRLVEKPLKHRRTTVELSRTYRFFLVQIIAMKNEAHNGISAVRKECFSGSL